MPRQVKLLSARRAYEFKPDEIRLTVLSDRLVIDAIKRAFEFEVAEINTPLATFGAVTPTFPPGLVFNLGTARFPDGPTTAIRFMHFEQRRIVIEVAGESAAIDAIFAGVRDLLADLKAPDGWPAIGEPVATLDSSVVTASLAFASDQVLAPGLRSLLTTALARTPGSAANEVLVPAIEARSVRIGEEYPGAIGGDYRTIQLAPRANTDPDDSIYFSAAPLETDAHVAMLAEIEAVLSVSKP